MPSALLKALYEVQQILCLLQSAVKTFLRFLWLENIMILIHFLFILKIVNQVKCSDVPYTVVFNAV